MVLTALEQERMHHIITSDQQFDTGAFWHNKWIINAEQADLAWFQFSFVNHVAVKCNALIRI